MEKFFAEFKSYFTDTSSEILWKIVLVAFIILLAKLVIALLRRIIRRAFQKSRKIAGSEERAKTLSQLTCGVMRFLVWFIALAAIFDQLKLGVTAGGLLATAGVGGLALGIGAQAFIADVVNGFTLMLENQYAIGEYVDLSGTVGTVSGVSLRTTTLTLPNGEIAVLPNGQIKKTVNYSRSNYTLFYETQIARDSSPEHAGELLLQTAREYAENHGESCVGKPCYVGVSEAAPMHYTLRLTLLVAPLRHWQTERDLNALVWRAFTEAGIAPPETRVRLENQP